MSKGTVYLLCFSKKFAHARHYLGFVNGGDSALEARLDRHRRGAGARLIEVITQEGIDFTVVRTWQGNRKLERRLKKQKNSYRLCPVCRNRQKA